MEEREGKGHDLHNASASVRVCRDRKGKKETKTYVNEKKRRRKKLMPHLNVLKVCCGGKGNEENETE